MLLNTTQAAAVSKFPSRAMKRSYLRAFWSVEMSDAAWQIAADGRPTAASPEPGPPVECEATHRISAPHGCHSALYGCLVHDFLPEVSHGSLARVQVHYRHSRCRA
jgi:hypothetical protein